MGLKLNATNGGGSVELDVPDTVSSDVALTLPANDGDADQVLQTNGSGTLSWSHLYGPSFRARLSDSQSLGNGEWTTAILNTENWDTDSCFDTSNGRFTPNKAGIYYINVQTYLNYSGGDPNRFGIRIYKNGSWFAGDVTSAPNDYWGFAELSTLVDFNGSTDYVDLRAYILGATAGVQMLSGYTNMSGFYVRPE